MTAVAVVSTSYEQPQSADEIRAFVRQMRETLRDDKLDIVWNPRFRVAQVGSFDAAGNLRPPIYAGRWQVIRRQTAGARDDSGTVVICTVCTYTRVNGILCLDDHRHADYEPVDGRLLELLRSADAANARQFQALRDRLWAANDHAEAERGLINDSEARAGLDHAHFKANYAGGVGNWKGKGVDLDAHGHITTNK